MSWENGDPQNRGPPSLFTGNMGMGIPIFQVKWGGPGSPFYREYGDPLAKIILCVTTLDHRQTKCRNSQRWRQRPQFPYPSEKRTHHRQAHPRSDERTHTRQAHPPQVLSTTRPEVRMRHAIHNQQGRPLIYVATICMLLRSLMHYWHIHSCHVTM